MRKIYSSYLVSVPAFALGIVALIQANTAGVTVTADSLNATDKIIGAKPVLIVAGIILILIAASSVLLRYIKKKAGQ